ncbi:MAG: hypothetical protein ABH950_01190 [Candidatus Altiarchaeota archaeon]
MDPLKIEKYRDFKIEIYSDGCSEDPREAWDNLCTMICFHKRYTLGDKHDFSSSDFQSWIELKKALMKNHGAYLIEPLFMLDHSGITIRMGYGFGDVDPQGWDWGQIGYIWTSREKILKEYGVKRISPEIKEKVQRIMQSEIEIYDQYLRGEIYGYTIEDPVGDSCWGYYGYDFEKNGLLDDARNAIDWYIEQTVQMRAEANIMEVGN